MNKSDYNKVLKKIEMRMLQEKQDFFSNQPFFQGMSQLAIKR